MKKVAKKNNIMKVTKKSRRKWFKIHKEKKSDEKKNKKVQKKSV